MSMVIEETREMVVVPMVKDYDDRSGLAVMYVGKALNVDNPLEHLQVLRLLVEAMMDNPPRPDFTELRYELRSALIRLINADATFGEDEYQIEMRKALNHIDEAIKLVSNGQ